jgi:uncharacterized protein (TIGR00369 family)
VADNLFDQQALVIPFVRHLGFVLTRFQDGESRIEYETRPEHMNTFQVAHGGVVMTLLDVAMATAARSTDPDMGVVTIEMKTTFMLPSKGRVIAEGRLIHRTATMAFVEAFIRSTPGGRASAHATGTFKFVKRLPVGPKGANGPTVISTD